MNNNFPYFSTKSAKKDFVNARFLKRKYLPVLRRTLPLHYLVTQDHRKYLSFVKNHSKKYPYFLCFDVEKYFPNINHQILLNELVLNYKKLTHKSVSRNFERLLKKDIPLFLQQSPLKNNSLALGNPLSHILAGIYLLRLDLSFKNPFLRFCDDYLVFFKTEKELKEILFKINNVLESLELHININKLQSGRFHKNKCKFLGFQFYAGHTTISEQKIETFKKRIIRITHLTKKKPVPAVIKLLNNKVLGFGHYYKFASCNNNFKDLDTFIRFRLRRYILRNRNLLPKTSNLLLTNQALKELNLKSLSDIKQTFDRKNKRKIRKTAKIKNKTGKKINNDSWLKSEQIADKYLLKQILLKLNELSDTLKKLEEKVTK
jgi:hypothetical protein